MGKLGPPDCKCVIHIGVGRRCMCACRLEIQRWAEESVAKILSGVPCTRGREEEYKGFRRDLLVWLCRERRIA